MSSSVNSRSHAGTRIIPAVLVRLLYAIGADAVLGGFCGALYGIVFGGMVPVVRGEFWEIASIAGTCALAGLVIGLLGGDWRKVLESEPMAGSERGRELAGRQDSSRTMERTGDFRFENWSPSENSPPAFAAGGLSALVRKNERSCAAR
jgi:hypothetical protein